MRGGDGAGGAADSDDDFEEVVRKGVRVGGEE